MEKVFIVGAKRSPIGSMHGTLSDFNLGELGAIVVKGAIQASGINPNDIEEVIMGNIFSAGIGPNIARQVSIKAGLPVEVPAYCLNMQCGSGMKSVINAYTSIRSGLKNVILAGGLENMSSTPMIVPGKVKRGHKMGNLELEDHMFKDGLIDGFLNYHMGITAENIVEKYGISRKEQDKFALNSQLKAKEALEQNKFENELVDIEIVSKRGINRFIKDEYPKPNTNMEVLASLKPAFKERGTVTAGNTSGISDAASATILVSQSYLENNKVNPLVEIIGIGEAGVDPSIMGMGPVPAIHKALKMANISFDDLQAIELNEAFAGQVLGVVNQLSIDFNIDREKILDITNINGGAIALGHPVGATGNRIIVTLINIMKEKNLDYGLATLCIGGGMGTALILKNIG